MIEGIQGIGDLGKISEMLSGSVAADGEETVFRNILTDLLTSEYANNMSTEEIISGNIDNLVTAMIDMAKADLTLQYTMQVRNKVVDAYQEIMKMQV
jgi:flagellar hook-basal body complex protein FliE